MNDARSEIPRLRYFAIGDPMIYTFNVLEGKCVIKR